jgi:hypothetical protein
MNKLTILILFAAISCSGGKKNITINDLRKNGLPSKSKEWDIPFTGSHYSGEVVIEREFTIMVNSKTEMEDTADVYNIHVYKTTNNILDRFHYMASARKNFDKATLKWVGDTADIDFLNSSTHEKAKIKIPIDAHGNGASIMDSVFWGFGK